MKRMSQPTIIVIEPPISNHPKCKDLVVVYRRSLCTCTWIKPQGSLPRRGLDTSSSCISWKKMILSSYTDRVTSTNLNNITVLLTLDMFSSANSQLKHLTLKFPRVTDTTMSLYKSQKIITFIVLKSWDFSRFHTLKVLLKRSCLIRASGSPKDLAVIAWFLN